MLFGDDALGSLPPGGNVESDVTGIGTVAATTSATSAATALAINTASVAASTSTSTSIQVSSTILSTVSAQVGIGAGADGTPIDIGSLSGTTSVSSSIQVSSTILATVAATTSTGGDVDATPVITGTEGGTTSVSLAATASPVAAGAVNISTSVTSSVVVPQILGRARPLKLEDSETGLTTDDFPTTFDRNTNYLDARGVTHQSASSNDIAVRTERIGDDLVFVDPAAGSVTLSEVLQRVTRSIVSTGTSTAAGDSPNTDYVYFVSGTSTITMPTAVGNTNLYSIKNVGAGTVTVAFTGGQTGEGSSTLPLLPNDAISLLSDNVNYHVF